MTDPMFRVPDAEAAAPFTIGMSANSYPWGFVLDFLAPDPTGQKPFVSARRVFLEPSAVEDAIGALTNALESYKAAHGDPNA